MDRTLDSTQLNITHNPAANRFETTIPGAPAEQLAVVDYRRQGETIYITRTYTPPQYRGRGIAAAVTEAALQYARAEGLTIVPVCSYTVDYLANEANGG